MSEHARKALPNLSRERREEREGKSEREERREDNTLKVLWVAKNRMLREEVRQLKAYAEKNGMKLKLDSYVGKVPSVEWLVRKKILPGGYGVVVAVLPLSMMSHLVALGRRYGFEVWRPKVEILHLDWKIPCPEFDGARDVMMPTVSADGDVAFAHKRFLHYERVRAIELLAEPIEVE